MSHPDLNAPISRRRVLALGGGVAAGSLVAECGRAGTSASRADPTPGWEAAREADPGDCPG